MESRMRLVTTLGRGIPRAPMTSNRPGFASRLSQDHMPWSLHCWRTYATKKPRRSPTAKDAEKARVWAAQQPTTYVGLKEMNENTLENKAIWDQTEDAFRRALYIFDAEFTPQECNAAAKLFVTLKKENSSIRWMTMEKEHRLSRYKLHLLGIMLFHAGQDNNKVMLLGWSMLRMALSSAYLPSVLTLLRLLGNPEQLQGDNVAIYQDAKSILATHLQNRRGGEVDTNALTMAGILAEREGNEKLALQRYQQALLSCPAPPRAAEDQTENSQGSTDSPSSLEAELESAHRDPRWVWEGSCLEGIWRLGNKHGKRQEALAAIHTAALELNMPFAHLELAKLPLKDLSGPFGKALPGDQDQKAARSSAHLLEAASAGIPEACRRQAELEEWWAETAKDKTTAREHRILAAEWHLLGKEPETPGKSAGSGSRV